MTINISVPFAVLHGHLTARSHKNISGAGPGNGKSITQWEEMAIKCYIKIWFSFISGQS